MAADVEENEPSVLNMSGCWKMLIKTSRHRKHVVKLGEQRTQDFVLCVFDQ